VLGPPYRASWTPRIPADAKKTIDLFLTQNDDALAVTAPEANGYEFQSSGVVEMLEKLLAKFSLTRYNDALNTL
jgi:hypothetical protein